MNRPDPSRMIRTTVYIPADVMDRARAAAAVKGITIAAIVRSALDSTLGTYRPPPTGGFLSVGSADSAGSASSMSPGWQRERSDL